MTNEESRTLAERGVVAAPVGRTLADINESWDAMPAHRVMSPVEAAVKRVIAEWSTEDGAVSVDGVEREEFMGELFAALKQPTLAEQIMAQVKAGWNRVHYRDDGPNGETTPCCCAIGIDHGAQLECYHQWLDRPESDSRQCLICDKED